MDRFCVLGRVEDHIAKLTKLRDLGADHFAIYLMHDAQDATLDAYGRSIVPVLAKATVATTPQRNDPAQATPPSRGHTVSDWRSATAAEYERKGFSGRTGYGTRPALLVVDFINGFTDSSSAMGGDYSAQLHVMAELLAQFRATSLPIFFTSLAYEPHLRDGGVFVQKVPALGFLIKGSEWVKVDDRIRPQPAERVVEKQYPSAFFDTMLDMELRALSVDTVVMVGCTTSGNIRASAIDSMQYGFRTVVVRDAVGDRAKVSHEANLFDIDAKYGDVVSSEEVLGYLRGLGERGGLARAAAQDFQRWWSAATAR